MSLATFIKDRARELGFQAAGFAPVEEFAEAEAIALERVDRGLLSGLGWFTPARVRLAARPRDLFPEARSLVVLAASYLTPKPDEEPSEPCDGPRGRVARYAWGDDYHEVLRARLRELVEQVGRERGSMPRARIFVDSSPLLEREAARRAGVGWFGKNTNILIHGLGSWAFLSAILLDVDLPVDEALLTHCGSCDLCLRACPTGALIDPYTLDSNLCISHQTIENRGPIPEELRPLLEDWVFGCDICQDVCPVNRKAAASRFPAFHAPSSERARPDLLRLLEMDTAAYQERFRATALKRAKQTGLQRNAAVALGNRGDDSAMPALERQLAGAPQGVVRSHVAWAMGRIGGRRSRRALEAARAGEPDAGVRREIENALDRM